MGSTLHLSGRRCMAQREIVIPNKPTVPSGADLVMSGQSEIVIDRKVGRINTLVGVWPADQVEVEEAHLMVDAHDLAVYS